MRRLILLVALFAGCGTPPVAADALPVERQAPPALSLGVTSILPGATATFTVHGLAAGERAYVLRGPGLSAAGPCPAVIGGLCLDLRAPPALVGSAVADPTGTATLSLTIPAGAPAGLTLAFQAVAVRGIGGASSVKSQALTRQVGVVLPTPVADLVAGDLVVTEVMHSPTTVADAAGAWFEVANTTAATVDLHGLQVEDGGGEAFTVSTSVVVAPGGLVVFGALSDPGLNGGVAVDYAWSGFTLDATDAIVLSNPAGELDAVAWDGTFPPASGRSLSLDPAGWSASGNDLGAVWCAAPVAPGTPGVVNDACPVPACGDGALDPGEECDDGGLVAGDGCDALCVIEPACGDGALDPGEECDDGGLVAGDGCDALCMIEPACGDGTLDPGEECDDGGLVAGDGCDALCMLEPACGDGALDPGEECDDGGLVLGDGCDDLCLLEGCPVPELLIGRWTASSTPGAMSEATRLSDGSVAIGGQLTTAANSGAWMSVIDASGTTVPWSSGLAYFSGVPIRALVPTADGGVYVVGVFKAGNPIDDQTGVARLAADGSVVWKQYVGTSTGLSNDLYEQPTHAVATSDGGLVIIGADLDVHPFPAETMAMMKKVSSGGALQWQAVWEHIGGGVGPPLANAVVELLDGSFFVGGDKPHLQSYTSTGTRMLELNAYGTLLVDDLALAANGDVLMSARSGTYRSPQLARISPGGTEVWTRTVVHTTTGASAATRVIATPETCGAGVVDGAACPAVGDACATPTEICRCDAAWTCDPGEQTFVLAWQNSGGSGSVPASTGAMWTTFQPNGTLIETRGVATGVNSVHSMDPDDGGLVSVGWTGGEAVVLRMSAGLDGVCDMVDYTGLRVTAGSLGLSPATGPWGVTVGPRVATWPGGPTPQSSPALSTVCSEALCP